MILVWYQDILSRTWCLLFMNQLIGWKCFVCGLPDSNWKNDWTKKYWNYIKSFYNQRLQHARQCRWTRFFNFVSIIKKIWIFFSYCCKCWLADCADDCWGLKKVARLFLWFLSWKYTTIIVFFSQLLSVKSYKWSKFGSHPQNMRHLKATYYCFFQTSMYRN